MYNHKVLRIARPNISLANRLSRGVGISRILAQILINRGIKTEDEADKFLNVRLDDLLDPYSLAGMHEAVRLVKKSAKDKAKVMVVGDYDADGITSTALLKTTLSKIGLEAVHYIPHRVKEGYGLNKNILNLAKKKKIKLLITADCGISNHQQISELRRSNIDVIITDHHEPLGSDLPAANSIINPKLKDSSYKYRDLAGVGVAYKFCQAVTNERLLEDLDLVSLGTIADVVPLTGENRIIAKEGLARLTNTKRVGLKALIHSSGIKDKNITPTFVSYILGPRLNASGRIDTAEIALSLLMSREEIEAENFAQLIESHNRQRQKIEREILEEAQVIIDREVNFKDQKVIVVGKENWHPGVLGIVASRLVDKFYRPVIALSLAYDLCKGSARSIKNFHLFQALSECKHLLETFGGHAHAAGLVITRDSIEDFKKSINRLATERLVLEDLLPSLDIDMELGLCDLDDKIARELELLEPCGTDNPQPLFYTRSLKLKGRPQVLAKNTLKFWVTDNDITYPAIGFGLGGLKDSLLNADCLDLVYAPKIDDWQDERAVILEVKDIFFK